MSTAVSTSPTGDEARKVATSVEARGLHAHKPGEGYATRLGMMVVCMAYVGFACWHWYYQWVYLRNFVDGVLSAIGLSVLVSWTYPPAVSRAIALLGTFAVAGIGFFFSYYFIYVKRASAEFLIKTDIELSKVTWPKITPWFKVESQVWGATYVVLIVVVLMTLYVFLIDIVLKLLSGTLFYR